MIIKLTKNPVVSLLLSIFAIILLSFKLYNEQSQAAALLSNTYSLIDFPAIESPLLLVCLLIPAILLSSILFTKINSKHRLIEHSLSPFFLFFVTGLLIFPFGPLYYTVFIALLLCIVALRLLLSIYNQPSVMIEIFLATTLIAIATILFYPTLIFILLLISAVTILRPFRLRNYVLILVAFVLPFIYLLSIDFIFELNLQKGKTPFNLIDLSVISERRSYIPFIILCALALLSFLSLFTSHSKFIVRQRNLLTILYIFTSLLFIISFFTNLSNLLVFILLPLSLFFTYFHKNFSRRWIPEVILLALYFSGFLLNNI